jgi:hypothetical protein
MFPFRLARLVVAASLGLALLPCAAQDGDEVTLQFLSFPKMIDPKPVELRVGEDQTIEVQIPTNEFSAPYKVKRLGTWAVGKSVTGEDGKPAFQTFGSSKALASPKQLILLVRKGPENADGMEVIPIDNQVGNFGGGKFLFMNAARIDIAGIVGEEKFALQPGKHIIIQPKAELKERDHCQSSFYFRKDEEAKPFFSSTWPVNRKARGLVFFYHDPNTQRLRLHTIRTFL